MLAKIAVGTPLRHVLLGSAQSRVVIFTLHLMADPTNGIYGIDEQALRLVLQRLCRLKMPIVGLEDVLYAERGARRLPPVSVCVTLDDGYHDQGEVSLPLLLAHEARPMLFMNTGFLDGLPWPWMRGCANSSDLGHARRSKVGWERGDIIRPTHC